MKYIYYSSLILLFLILATLGWAHYCYNPSGLGPGMVYAPFHTRQDLSKDFLDLVVEAHKMCKEKGGKYLAHKATDDGVGIGVCRFKDSTYRAVYFNDIKFNK